MNRKLLLYLLFLYFIFLGAAYSQAEDVIRQLIYSTNMPFLPTPMGKGVVPDSDKRCVSSARTYALQHSDVILLLGARLNWMLHFGRPPRFQSNVKVIQVPNAYFKSAILNDIERFWVTYVKKLILFLHFLSSVKIKS